MRPRICEQLGGIQRALVELRAGLDPIAVLDVEPGARRERVGLVLALRVGDDHLDRLVGLLDRDLAGDLRHLRQALRLARLEQLDDARQALRDVVAGDAAGVEGAHGQLRAGLADRLRGDDPDRVAQLDHRAGRHRRARSRPGRRPDSSSHLSTERTGIVTSSSSKASAIASSSGRSISWPRFSSSRPRLVANFFAATRPIRFWFRLAVVGAERHLDELLGLAVLGAHDHVLGDVDEAPRQVAGVGGPQRRVGEALAGAVRGDEVLEHRQALHEVGLDRPLDDLALRVGHQAAHPGELADLLERPAGSRVGHHEDRVQLVEVVLHRLARPPRWPCPSAR